MKMPESLLKSILLSIILFTFVSAETYNAILFSWDGAQRQHLEELIAAKKVPAIQAFKEEGAYVPIQVTGHGTVTSAGHAQMLTGLTSKVNKVSGNDRFEPIPEGFTIFERLENGLGKDNIVTCAFFGKSNYLGSLGPEALKDKKVPKYLKKGEPYYNARKSLDVWFGDRNNNAETVAEKGLGFIEQYKDKRFFMFFHFVDPDTSGHTAGENSEDYNDALIRCDALVGKIVEKLKALKIYDKTLVYVTADHGFNEGTDNHPSAPDVFLATNDKTVKKSGTQEDITPTILKQFNIDPAKLEPPPAGKPLN